MILRKFGEGGEGSACVSWQGPRRALESFPVSGWLLLLLRVLWLRLWLILRIHRLPRWRSDRLA